MLNRVSGNVSTLDISSISGIPGGSSLSLDNSLVRSALAKPSGKIDFADAYADYKILGDYTVYFHYGVGGECFLRAFTSNKDWIVHLMPYYILRTNPTTYTHTWTGPGTVTSGGSTGFVKYSYVHQIPHSNIKSGRVQVFDSNLNYMRYIDIPSNLYMYNLNKDTSTETVDWFNNVEICNNTLVLSAGSIYTTSTKYNNSFLVFNLNTGSFLRQVSCPAKSVILTDPFTYKIYAYKPLSTTSVSLTEYDQEGNFLSERTITSPEYQYNFFVSGLRKHVNIVNGYMYYYANSNTKLYNLATGIFSALSAIGDPVIIGRVNEAGTISSLVYSNQKTFDNLQTGNPTIRSTTPTISGTGTYINSETAPGVAVLIRHTSDDDEALNWSHMQVFDSNTGLLLKKLYWPMHGSVYRYRGDDPNRDIHITQKGIVLAGMGSVKTPNNPWVSRGYYRVIAFNIYQEI